MQETGGLQGYAIERKLAEGQFVEIAYVPARGTIGEKVTYNYGDFDLQNEKFHEYRIKAEYQNELPTLSAAERVWVGMLDRFMAGTLYPNPATETTQLEIQVKGDHFIEWKLYSMQGMELKNDSIPVNNGEFTLSIDLRTISG